MRVLTCIGDATSITAHGGLPYHLLDAGKRAGFLDAGWSLDPRKLRCARASWSLCSLLSRGQLGGFQYTETFLHKLVRQVPKGSENPEEIVSIFPLLPADPPRHAKISFYIDATLRQNFEDYGIGKKVGRAIVEDALRREREAYGNADRIICRSHAAAKSVVENYGVEAKKLHVVPGGANIIAIPATSAPIEAVVPLTPVRLGFLGKDWRRKNLAFVLAIADVLCDRGVGVEIIAAGFDPKSGPRHRLLKSVGFLDKRSQMQTFADFIRSCHFTCLFSHAEAFGLSNVESLRLGVPVLASDVGGISDTIPAGCGHLFSRSAEAQDIATTIEAYVRDPDRYSALREHVGRRSAEFSWDAAIEKMQAIWSGSDAYRYRGSASRA